MNRLVVYAETNGVGVLTLNRPERLNAISVPMLRDLLDLVLRLTKQRRLRALVVTGAGRGFCSGADLSSDGIGDSAPLERSGGDLASNIRSYLNPLIVALTDAPFPVIAALNGPAAGAGVGLALACDIVVASESAFLQLSFSRIGMGMDAGTSWFLVNTIGLKRASVLAMLAEPVSPAQMLAWGLVWQVVEHDKLMSESIGLAQRLADGATVALAEQKRQLQRATESSLADSLNDEAMVQGRLIHGDDVKRGVSAFREGRQPVFRSVDTSGEPS